MKRLLSCLVALMLLAGLFAVPVRAEEDVRLVMGSWRSDDAERLQAFLDVYKEKTGVSIKFEPTQSAQYNSTLSLQLENGTGPDLFYARSYEPGRVLFEAGHMMDCSDVPGVKENFVKSSLDPWTSKDGKLFAVPMAAVSHVVYYNKDYFDEKGLSVPETFEDFMALCQKIKDEGMNPLANGIASDWDILECVFLGMLPNYVGGADMREKYESGELKMDDENFMAALEDFKKLCAYLPEGFESVENSDGPTMLGTDQAAMFIDGSWTCGTFGEFGLENWGAFAIPPREGKEAGMCFHPDCGVSGNPATQHPEEVQAFLAWMATPEGAQTMAEYLPEGFFPMMNTDIKLPDVRVEELLKLNDGRVTDARFVWPVFLDLYTPMLEDLNAISRGEKEPADVAAHWNELQAESIAARAK